MQKEKFLISRSRLADEAVLFVGYPSVRYGGPRLGMSESGFDCSGFIKFLLNRINFPCHSEVRHTNEFFDFFGVFIHEEYVGAGDLVFFSWDGCVPRHMGIMLSKDSYIHAPGLDNTIIETAILKKMAIKNSCNGQIYFHNPIGFKRLAIKVSRYQQILND
ncbi:MAG: NlpC/P60 family protein [bacterium]|nr:NlpC/P60 family protein [bacterium]